MNELYPFPSNNSDQYLLKLAHINVRQGVMPEHDQDFAELIVALDGHCINIINGVASFVLPGDIFVVLPGMPHEYRDMNDYRFCIIKFDYELLMHEAGDIKNLPGFQLLFVIEPHLKIEGKLESVPTLDADTLLYTEMTTKILERELSEKPPEYQTFAKHMFMSLVSLVSRRCIRKEGGVALRNANSAAIAASYMEKNFGNSITLDELARLTNYSRRHFTRLFREHFATSPMNYLNKIRMKNASHLLSTSNLSIADIAAKNGFSDSGFFSRSFKTYWGKTPGEYRAGFSGSKL